MRLHITWSDIATRELDSYEAYSLAILSNCLFFFSRSRFAGILSIEFHRAFMPKIKLAGELVCALGDSE
jgi:hypothetical protein